MPYFPPEVVAEVRKIDLYTYLKNYEPNELVHYHKDTFTTKEHDSVRIDNGLWNWCSAGIGGRSALDYLINVRGIKFEKAMEIILNNVNIQTPISYEYIPKKVKKNLILPVKNYDNNKVISYLRNRGIDREIIQDCIDKKIIYEDQNHNVVFVGYDENNKAKYAMCRATNCSRFMHDIKGSSKDYSFKLVAEKESKSVHLFESAIDLLSYATLLKIYGHNYKNFNLVSLSGVYQPAKVIRESKVPIAIQNFLKINSNITQIYLHLDNDIAGIGASNALKIVMEKEYEIIDKPVPSGKDVNDYLCQSVLKIPKNISKEIVR